MKVPVLTIFCSCIFFLNSFGQDTLKTITTVEAQCRHCSNYYLVENKPLYTLKDLEPYLLKVPETLPEIHKVKFAFVAQLTSAGLIVAAETIGSIVWHKNPNEGYLIEGIGVIPFCTLIYYSIYHTFHFNKAIKVYNQKIPIF
jgi:hypothetical protein